MGFELFEHNQKAYESVVEMLDITGKAAVVHPTGTGKSFIGYKLCMDNPNMRICWLSPSEYIYKTQLENFEKAGGSSPENILFFTYAKLMNMSRDEMGEISPDYIILDEFHRCGAEMWGAGVNSLLSEFPRAKILGLSATAIRYLDNQRNMAQELFDSNIASEMTLGEAIVRGILNPPKYVLSVYSYKKDLERIEGRIKSAKSQSVRDKASKEFEALRRALDMAEGLDKIFEKHITERNGKYIVFCADYEHMQEMSAKAKEWFSCIDKEPHVYTVYSNDAEASSDFARFKDDESNHLKLLYCIDMLNEGIHVDKVSGVILLRPTVSPIIYKQQIGRALSASKNTTPVIFDIVLNIENLYSIGTIEEEMQSAISYYKYLNENYRIVNDKFEIIDEVRDCKELFERLNDTLSASWDIMFSYAKEYFEKNGHLEIPKRYQTEDGYSLGSWIMTQRKVREGKQYGSLSARQIKKLDSIGMRWESHRDMMWETYYSEAKKYFEKHNCLDMAATYVTESGITLGRWIAQMRIYRKSGIKSSFMNEEKIKLLDEIGMKWSMVDYLWESNFADAMEFFKENGHLDIPVDFTSKTGKKIGVWIRKLRKIRETEDKKYGAKLTDIQVSRLDEIGMIWSKKSDTQWNKGYEEAKAYYKENGHLNVPTLYTSESGFALGKWIYRQREKELSKEKRTKLSLIGMIWKKEDPWLLRYKLAKAYFDEHGDLNVSGTYVVDGIWIGKWLNEQKHICLGNRPGKALTNDQLTKLKSIGFAY